MPHRRSAPRLPLLLALTLLRGAVRRGHEGARRDDVPDAEGPRPGLLTHGRVQAAHQPVGVPGARKGLPPRGLRAGRAERHPRHRPTIGTASATVRFISYNSVLTLGVSPEGLHVSTMLFYRPAHRPLLIPWSEITASPAKRLFFEAVRLDFRSVPSVAMVISKSAGDRLLASAPVPLSSKTT